MNAVENSPSPPDAEVRPGNLAVSRYFGQGVMIGDDIEVVVSKVRPSDTQIRLVIRAPREIRILRKEIWLRIRGEHGTPVRERDAKV
jgi:carbon storage regulator